MNRQRVLRARHEPWGSAARPLRRLWVALALGISSAVVLGAPAQAVSPQADTAPTTLSVDVAGPSSTPSDVFQGVGALSAGATSRLLMDYPRKQRNQILDYLFKPDYGASLDVLKVEIGGDTDSTAGSEPSHERVEGQVDCNRGYEWALMEAAKKRNPHIKLWGLQWGAPAWVGSTVYTSKDVDYQLDWLQCARQHHLKIDLVGGWNERSAAESVRSAYYQELRRRMDAAGFGSTGILIGDEDGNGAWSSATDLSTDPALRAVVSALGGHYPCRGSAKGSNCASGANAGTAGAPSTAQSLGLPLWASEMGSDNYVTGAAGLARAYNRQYVEGGITGSINWSLASCWYNHVTAYAGDGLLDCETPWSGNYIVDRQLWATAQTTQFSAPGWRYDRADSGEDPLVGGSYVTLKSPSGADFSTVVETTQATAPQTITLTGLGDRRLHVWDTDLTSADPRSWFQDEAAPPTVDGAATVTLQPGRVYTLTSLASGHHGDAQPPANRQWNLPYHENFNGYPVGATPRYMSDQEGTWETAACQSGAPGATGRDGAPDASRGRGVGHRGEPTTWQGKCLEQTVATKPVRWRPETLNPLTVVGDPSWGGDYTVGVDALITQSGTDAELAGRVSGFDLLGTGLAGYHLRLDADGSWTLFRETTGNKSGNHVDTTLASGQVPMGNDGWHRLGLRFDGDHITPLIDGRAVGGPVIDDTYTGGQVGLQIGGFYQAQFDNLEVTPTA